jgi:hypothetical protein
MSKRTLQRIRRGLPRTAPLRLAVNDSLQAKLAERNPDDERIPLFVATHASSKQQRVSLKKLLRDSEASWPLEKKFFDPRVTYRCTPEAGFGFRNHTAASLDIKTCNIDCDCDRYDSKYKWNGHVLTVDTHVLTPLLPEDTAPDVRRRIEDRGSKFRFSLSDLEAVAQLRRAALTYAEKCRKRSRLDMSAAAGEDWADSLCEAFLTEPGFCNR